MGHRLHHPQGRTASTEGPPRVARPSVGPSLSTMNESWTWGVITFVLMVAWCVAVALAVVALSDWSTVVQMIVGAAIGGPGAVLILALRMRRLPRR